MTMSPSSNRPDVLGLLAALLLSGCASVGDPPSDPASESPSSLTIQGHGLNWSRLTVGPYEVRNIKSRYRHSKSKKKDEWMKVRKSTQDQTYGFTLSEAGQASWKAECKERVTRVRRDTILAWRASYSSSRPRGEEWRIGDEYGEGQKAVRVQFDCRFQSPTDISWSDRMGIVTAEMGLYLRDEEKDNPGTDLPSVLLDGGGWLRGTRDRIPYPLERWRIEFGREEWASLDVSRRLIDLAPSLAGSRKTYAIAALVALSLRHDKPGPSRSMDYDSLPEP